MAIGPSYSSASLRILTKSDLVSPLTVVKHWFDKKCTYNSRPHLPFWQAFPKSDNLYMCTLESIVDREPRQVRKFTMYISLKNLNKMFMIFKCRRYINMISVAVAFFGKVCCCWLDVVQGGTEVNSPAPRTPPNRKCHCHWKLHTWFQQKHENKQKRYTDKEQPLKQQLTGNVTDTENFILYFNKNRKTNKRGKQTKSNPLNTC